MTLRGDYYYNPIFQGEETQAQRRLSIDTSHAMTMQYIKGDNRGGDGGSTKEACLPSLGQMNSYSFGCNFCVEVWRRLERVRERWAWRRERKAFQKYAKPRK